MSTPTEETLFDDLMAVFEKHGISKFSGSIDSDLESNFVTIHNSEITTCKTLILGSNRTPTPYIRFTHNHIKVND